MNNGKQMSLGHLMYAEDYEGLLITGLTNGATRESALRVQLVRGTLDYTSSKNNWEPTNTIAKSPLQNISGIATRFGKCPADASMVIRPDGVKWRVLPPFHNGAAGLSFADGYSEIHRWKGSRIRPKAMYLAGFMIIQEAGDSLNDVKWWSENTSVPWR